MKHRPRYPHPHAQQRGAVLIVSLILLVALTLIGVSVMNTSQLEERMASNAQEVVQAFQSAETGLSQAYDNPNSWDPVNDLVQAPQAIVSAVGRTDQVGYTVRYLVDTKPPVGSLYDAVNFGAAHFDFESNGTSQSQLESTVHGGGRRIVPKLSN